MRRFIPAILCVAAAGCAPVYVSTDYDPGMDFSTFKTWAWDPKPAHAPSEAGVFAIQRARHEIERELTAKGYAMAPESEADFLVDVQLSVERRIGVEPYRVGIGWGWGYRWGPFWRGYWELPPAVYAYDEGVLVVNIFQNKPTRRPAWRGVAELPLSDAPSPEERHVLIREAVRKVLSKFPPK
jgi:hypothetical protein